MSPPAATARDARTLGTLAAACAALVLVVVASSAWLRLAAVPCPPGGCAEFGLADAVRLAHRVAAMGVTVLALLVTALAWKPPVRPALRATAVLALVLIAALAVVGRRSAGAAPPAVLLANLLGGLTLLAACVGLAAAARAPGGRISLAYVAAAALLAAALVTGGVLATSPPAHASGLVLAHRGLAWSAVAAWGLLALGAGTSPRARLAARLVAVALLAQAALAVAAPDAALARWLHNLLSSLALACAVAGALQARLPLRGDAGAPGSALARP
jgi:heme A synthase